MRIGLQGQSRGWETERRILCRLSVFHSESEWQEEGTGSHQDLNNPSKKDAIIKT
jgi:hypothetical protein